MRKDLDPTHPTRDAPKDDGHVTNNEAVSDTASDSGMDSDTSDWVERTLAKSRNDNRNQPWRKIFKSDRVLESMDNTMEDDKDLVVVPPKLPLAGEATIYEQQSLAG